MNDKNSIRIGCLASHNASVFRNLLERKGKDANLLDPVVLITNNPDAKALEVAAKHNVPAFIINKKSVGEENIDASIRNCLVKHGVELVILTGYMKKIGPDTLKTFEGRMLNSHPALLPKFGGQGMYGRHVHEAVVAAGEKTSGVTVHLVNAEYDKGDIIVQRSIPIEPGESADSVETRVKLLEPDAYLEAIKTMKDRV